VKSEFSGQDAELIAWRKQKRSELLAWRTSFTGEDRLRAGEMVLDRVYSLLRSNQTRVAGFYWPFRGEIDVLPLMHRFAAEEGTVALPVVVGRAQPLSFRLWEPGFRMTTGVFGIPYPAESRTMLRYGGGYYDRTLAVAEPRPLSIGIGFRSLRLETIMPQQYDLPMDYIVTESETIRRSVGDGPDASSAGVS